MFQTEQHLAVRGADLHPDRLRQRLDQFWRLHRPHHINIAHTQRADRGHGIGEVADRRVALGGSTPIILPLGELDGAVAKLGQ
ncbi:hypothetical protein [Corynebacterium tuberculostearicum]|uniref:hypothetical protein n=1 Tax=Corynebacterium tuberculostearicum TaxID=38304 RepID=UPI003F5CEC19